MNTLQKLLYTLAVVLLVISCKPDKQKQLIELKKQQTELTNQIQTLEKELMAADTTGVEEGIPVNITVLEAKPFAHFVEVHGKLDGEESLPIFPKSGGVVQKVFVQVGSAVKKGQILASLDDSAIQKTLDQTKSQYNLALELFERQSKLWEQKIGSEMQYLQAKSQKETLENAVASLQEQVDYTKIKSPINGTVENLPIKIGQGVSPAQAAAIVINFSSMKIVSDVPEAYGPSIRAGDSAKVFFPDLDKELATTITTSSKYINPVNRTFQIEAKVPSSDASFKTNMVAVIKIADYTNSQAITIPINYIQTDANGSYVFVASNQNEKMVATKKYIKQGKSYNGLVEITQGLVAGDKIITSGYLQLNEGVKIAIK